MSKIIMLCSGKGGSGTTTLTTNIGYVLAQHGARVLICDLNIGLRNDDIFLGMENSALFDLADVLGGMCTLEKAIIQCDCSDNLFLLPCPQGKTIFDAQLRNIHSMLDYLKSSYDVILLDVPSYYSPVFNYAALKSDAALLSLEKDYVSVRNTDAVSRKLESLGIDNRYYVVNRISESDLENEPSLDWIHQAMEINLAGVISYDEDIRIYTNKGIPVASMSPDFYKLFLDIALRIAG